ncbi:YgaP-like transmembrane domain [Stutzerimonas tarimensis]|uniref:YgaP-like transmembrane domain n=1 Tax=Stutzerimonas tarimensis TaxID=1507735 RepID=A0ABV7T028_9GAMM
MKSPFSSATEPNVHGWERTASIAGGLLFLGKGLRRGGIGGLLQLALGGMALARGMTGHCEAKRVLTGMKQEAKEQETGSSTSDTSDMQRSAALADDPVPLGEAIEVDPFDSSLPGANPKGDVNPDRSNLGNSIS